VVAPGGVLDQGAVGYENQVVLDQIEPSALSAADPVDASGHLAIGVDVELYVGDPCVVLDGDAMLLSQATSGRVKDSY
jgi:hypothetical protein